LPLDRLELRPKIPWDEGLASTSSPGEAAAAAELDRFLDDLLDGYAEGRDRPALAATSRLSPHLHFGEIGPRQVWHALQERVGGQKGQAAGDSGAAVFSRELGWREFAYHLLYHFPHTTESPLRAEFEAFPWKRSRRLLDAWRHGRTGYPLVDAGMRELWATGRMHNRARMVVASFLVKDLLIPWQEGAKWFWDTLVDADLANNTLGWQWTAGCGADAAPFFRVFNPAGQGERFDPEGDYVRQWVPELRGLPNRWVHRPWNSPPVVLRAAGVKLGKTYPKPIVDHSEARRRALAAFRQMRQ
jgi:deoxyribodipyrimidine photo-lyase